MVEVSVVLPTYNEKDNSPIVVKEIDKNLKNYDYEIIVVDDASNDNSYNEACIKGVWLLKHIVNLGQGGAIQTGIEFARQKNINYIITFDADGQHHPKDIEKVAKPILEVGYDVVVGSRLMDKNEVKNMPIVKRIGNWGLNFITYLMGGISQPTAKVD